MKFLEKIRTNYKYYLFSFFFISIISWGLELIFSLIFRGKLVNPGSLTLFWCPIYGFACLLVFLSAKKEDFIMINFIKIFLTVSVVEYLASYISEKYYNRLIWNYNNYFLNVGGRICLSMTILFTVFGLIWLYTIEPWQYKKYDLNRKKSNTFVTIASIAFAIDVFINWF